MPKKILLTGFTPFQKVIVNPSEQLAKLAPEKLHFEGWGIQSEILPTEFEAATRKIDELLIFHRPEIALSLGVAVDRPGIALEQLGVNWADASISDNFGERPGGQELVPGAPTALWSCFRGRRDMVDQLNESGFDARLSISAGTYVCNSVLYRALLTIRDNNLPAHFGFVHFARCPEDTAYMPVPERYFIPTLSIENGLDALKIVLSKLILNVQD